MRKNALKSTSFSLRNLIHMQRIDREKLPVCKKASMYSLCLTFGRGALNHDAAFAMQSYLLLSHIHMDGIVVQRVLPGRLNGEIPAFLTVNIPDGQPIFGGHDDALLRTLPLPEAAGQNTLPEPGRLIKRIGQQAFARAEQEKACLRNKEHAGIEAAARSG